MKTPQFLTCAGIVTSVLNAPQIVLGDIVEYRFVGEVTESLMPSGALESIRVGDRVSYRFGVDGDRPLYYSPNYALTYLLSSPTLRFETSSDPIVVRGQIEIPGGAGVVNDSRQAWLDPRLLFGWDGLWSRFTFVEEGASYSHVSGVFDQFGSVFQGLTPPTQLDISDFDVFQWDIEDENHLKVLTIAFRSVRVVPEPGNLGLLALALACGSRRRGG